MTYLGPNTVKSFIRTIYRKIDAGSRTQAVLWGVKHGCTPDQNRIEDWRANSEVSTFRLTTLDRTYHPYG